MKKRKKFAFRKSAETFKVFSEEARLRIIQVLFEKEMCVCDLEERLDMPQPLVSHHLKILKSVGFVHASRRGQRNYYFISPKIRKVASEAEPGILDFGCCEIKFKWQDKLELKHQSI